MSKFRERLAQVSRWGIPVTEGFAITAGAVPQTYDYWFTGMNLSHSFGRNLDMFMNYQFQYQDDNANGCIGSGCSTNVIRHQISFGVNLHRQPIPF